MGQVERLDCRRLMAWNGVITGTSLRVDDNGTSATTRVEIRYSGVAGQGIYFRRDGTTNIGVVMPDGSSQIYFSGLSSVIYDANGGDDNISINAAVPSTVGVIVNGGDGGDVLTGGPNADQLKGDAGGDSISGSDGNDSIYGGDQSDTLRGQDDDDVIYGGNSGDSIFGDNGNDVLYGDAGTDTVYGGNGNDVFHFNDGALDYVNSGIGTDTLDIDLYDTPGPGVGPFPPG